MNQIYLVWVSKYFNFRQLIAEIMKPGTIKQIFMKIFSKQLRRPYGLFAKRVGNKMNEISQLLEANHFKRVQIEKSNEPDQKIEGQYYNVESLCIASIPGQ